jgi:WSC domain-containing protein
MAFATRIWLGTAAVWIAALALASCNGIPPEHKSASQQAATCRTCGDDDGGGDDGGGSGGPPEPVCNGDGVCDPGETCRSCRADCGPCTPPPAVCGDGVCGAGESCASCAADCGACAPPAVCGDGMCAASETRSCQDCAAVIGCFRDAPTRILRDYLGTGFTIEACHQVAAGYGYTYFGLEAGGECYAGNSLDRDLQIADSSCNLACSAAPSEGCGGSWALRAFYTTRAPASDIFCGKGAMIDDGGGINYAYANVVQDTGGPTCWDNVGAGSPSCVFGGPCSDLQPRGPALTRTEIRGWISHLGEANPEGDYNIEQEYAMDIVLDVGWHQGPVACPIGGCRGPGTLYVNTLAQISWLIQNQNLIYFGNYTNYDGSTGGRHVGRVFGSPAPTVFGSPAPTVHLEWDGWGPSTGRGGPNYQTRIPYGWVQNGANGSSPLYFPADLAPGGRSFQVGDYVRVVGTFWRDEDHNTYDWGLVGGALKNPNVIRTANQCMRDVDGTNAWREMHPPDTIELLTEPAPRHTVVAYSLCDYSGSYAMTDTLDLTRAGSPGSAAYGPWVAPACSHVASITPATRGTVVSAATAFSDGRHATFQTGITATGSGMVLYDVVWAPGCPGGTTCGADGSCAPPAPLDCSGMGCGGLQVTFRTFDDVHYLGFPPDFIGRYWAGNTSPTGSAVFTLIALGDGAYALRSAYGNYATAEHGGDCPYGGAECWFSANRNAIGAWETWHLVQSGDRVGLRAFGGDFVTAENAGGGPANVNRPVQGPWETFTMSVVSP